MLRLVLLSCLAVILAPAGVIEGASSAQTSDAAIDLFARLVVHEEYDADAARAQVAGQFGVAAATDAAVYWCEPEPGVGCDETDVSAAWSHFINLVDGEGVAVDAAAMDVAEAFDDELATGIAVFWCAPEPYAGCDASLVGDSWVGFLNSVEEDDQAPARVRDAMAQDAPVLASAIYAYLCGPDESCGASDPGNAENPRVAQTGGRRHYRNKDCKTSPKPAGC